MRQYRGRIDDGGEAGGWVYGGIAINGDRAFIISIDECITCGKEPICQKEDFPCYRNAVEVISETVGQQIGKQDDKGQEIYEGDKIRFTNTFNNWQGKREPVSDVGVVEYNSNETCYDINRTLSLGDIGGHNILSLMASCKSEVTGDIHTEENSQSTIVNSQ